MSEQPGAELSTPESEKGKGGFGRDATSKLPADSAADVSPTGEPATPKKLTAEEQMALHESSLKEEDWGRQPC